MQFPSGYSAVGAGNPSEIPVGAPGGPARGSQAFSRGRASRANTSWKNALVEKTIFLSTIFQQSGSEAT